MLRPRFRFAKQAILRVNFEFFYDYMERNSGLTLAEIIHGYVILAKVLARENPPIC
jgi:hypothetical protein